MSLLSGTATYRRFRLDRPAPLFFDDTHLDALRGLSLGRRRVLDADGLIWGWTGGDHVLDVVFEQEKNVVNDLLVFAFCLEGNKIPAEKVKAYYALELAGLAKNNPSGLPSALNKREAKEAARDRIEQESKDGRYLRRQAIEIAWDQKSNELWYAASSPAHVPKALALFKQTFGADAGQITAGRLAHLLPDVDPLIPRERIEGSLLSPFIPSISPREAAWTPGEGDLDFLGNELLVWLWYQCEDESATIKLPDGSEVVVFPSKTLALACPRGMGGKDQFTHEGPTRMPEAFRGVQSGKLPRKAGLTLVRHDVQYEFVFAAEEWLVNGAKIPHPEEDAERARLEARVGQLRDLNETIDLLFRAFCRLRFSDEWRGQLARIQRWLAREERRG